MTQDLGKVASHISYHPKSSEILRKPSFLKSYMAAWVVANDAVPKASTLHNHGSGQMGRIVMEPSLGGTHSPLNHDGRKSSIPLLTIDLGCQETLQSTNTWTPRTSTSGQAWLNLGLISREALLVGGTAIWYVKKCSNMYKNLSIHNQCLWIYGLILSAVYHP